MRLKPMSEKQRKIEELKDIYRQRYNLEQDIQSLEDDLRTNHRASAKELEAIALEYV